MDHLAIAIVCVIMLEFNAMILVALRKRPLITGICVKDLNHVVNTSVKMINALIFITLFDVLTHFAQLFLKSIRQETAIM